MRKTLGLIVGLTLLGVGLVPAASAHHGDERCDDTSGPNPCEVVVDAVFHSGLCGDGEVGVVVNDEPLCVPEPNPPDVAVRSDSECDFAGDSAGVGFVVEVDGTQQRTGCFGLEDRCGSASGWWIVVHDRRTLGTVCFITP